MSSVTDREVVYILGLGATPNGPSQLRDRLTQTGLRLYEIQPDWQDRSASLFDLALGVGSQIDTFAPAEDAILLGHSLGSIIGCAEARRRQYGRLVLCSPSYAESKAIGRMATD